jgi:uncharacterized membrane protein
MAHFAIVVWLLAFVLFLVALALPCPLFFKKKEIYSAFIESK